MVAEMKTSNFFLMLVCALLTLGTSSAQESGDKNATSPENGGKPAATPLPAPPILIHFSLKEPGLVTLVIEDAHGVRIRNLVSETPFPAGDNTVPWDGRSDQGPGKGSLVAPGTYHVRGLARPELKLTFQMSPYYPGNPPWFTWTYESGWLSNHTPPEAICFIPGGQVPLRKGQQGVSPAQVLIGSYVAECASALAWVDLDGRKYHGQEWFGTPFTGVQFIARDEGKDPVPGVYAYTCTFKAEDSVNTLRLFELLHTPGQPEGRDIRWGIGETKAVLNPNYRVYLSPKPRQEDFYLADLGMMKPPDALAGLAVRNGILVCSLSARDELLFIDAAHGVVLGAAPIKNPRGIAFDRQGGLLVVTGKQLVRFELPVSLSNASNEPAPASKPTSSLDTPQLTLSDPTLVIATGLEDPQQIALDDKGNLYIGDWGNSHQVKVFSPEGTFVRAIGLPGKPVAGPYDPHKMHRPAGITITSDNLLWVAEDDYLPKRVSIWTLDGEFVRAYYGPAKYGGGGTMDPEDKNRFFYADGRGSMELKLDWKDNTAVPEDIPVRPEDDLAPEFAPPNMGYHGPETPLHVGGKTYLIDSYNENPVFGTSVSSVYLLKDGVARRVATIGQANEIPAFNSTAHFAVRWTGQIQPEYSENYTFRLKSNDGARLWVNGQQLIERWSTGWADPKGTIQLEAGKRYDIEIDYFQYDGDAGINLYWSSSSQKEQIVPTSDLFPDLAALTANVASTPVSSATTKTVPAPSSVPTTNTVAVATPAPAIPNPVASHGLTGIYYSDAGMARVLKAQVDPVIDFYWNDGGFLDLPAKFASCLPPGQTFQNNNRIIFAWSDLNDDGKVEPNEITMVSGETLSVNFQNDLSAVTGSGLLVKPKGFTPGGAPIYDIREAKTEIEGWQKPSSTGGGQALLDKDDRLIMTTAPKPFSPAGIGGVVEGHPTWFYPSPWPGLHASHGAPMPTSPGELIGTTRVLGPPFTPKGSDVGEMWAINGNKGNVYLLTTDGLFVATLFQDCRTATWNPPSSAPGTPVNNQSLREEEFYPTLTETSDGETYLTASCSNIVRIDGLDKVRSLPNQDLVLTSEDLSAAHDYSIAQEAARQQTNEQKAPSQLTIPMGGVAPVVDGKSNDWGKAKWVTIDQYNSSETRAALMVAGDLLYGSILTRDPNLLDNSGTSLQTLFKSGGGIDLMIGTDPAANPKRTQPVAGDLRLLMTKVAGKTVAVLYHAVVPGTTGDRVSFSSPARSVEFDRVDDVSNQIALESRFDPNIKKAFYEFSIPLSLLGLNPQPGLKLRGDIGVLRGKDGQTLQRSYWHNKATGLMSDIPSEAELTPLIWGDWIFAPEDSSP